MKHLVIKPTLSCTANCATCAYRRDLHKSVRKQELLSFAHWEKVLADARSLGAWHLTISGGEPTLYRHLPDLIQIGASYGWLVRLNSNGSMTDRIYAETLVKAGLEVVDISLYSPHPETHDQMRNSIGLWRNATTAIEIFTALQKQYSHFQVITQTILCRENYTDFADLLRLHYQLGSNGMVVSYLEGDFEKRHLLTQDEIQYFRAEILPKAQAVVEELHPHVRDIARCIVGSLFSGEILDAVRWAEGVYRPTPEPCKIPWEQALILANGDVHPCNIVEYTHGPVVGNVLQDSIIDIWQGEKWGQFRQRLHDLCKLCPMNRHVFIPLRPGNRWMAMAKYWLNKIQMGRLEQKIYPLVRRYRASRGKSSRPKTLDR
jgi:radical SAM protein with 4Fe4S-binding SPASM domain